jgi:hypothetical protein
MLVLIALVAGLVGLMVAWPFVPLSPDCLELRTDYVPEGYERVSFGDATYVCPDEFYWLLRGEDVPGPWFHTPGI